MQIFGSSSGATLTMTRGYQSNNGHITATGTGGGVTFGSTTIATNCYGIEMRFNIIHDQDNVVQWYVNGSKKLEQRDTESGIDNYHKYGCYGTTNGNVPAVVKWRKVRSFKDGSLPGGTLTPSKFNEVTVSASSSNNSFPPANTLDGDLGTRWAGNGDGTWIRYDLGGIKTVSFLKMGFYLGTTRSYKFDIQVANSTAGPWTDVLTNVTSSATTALQTIDFPDASGRYVRIVGHAGSFDTWNNYTEVEIWGTQQNFKYTPVSQSLTLYPGASGQFNQSVTAPKANGVFNASLLVVGTGNQPIPTSWISTSPSVLNFNTGAFGSGADQTLTWAVNVLPPADAAPGTYTANICATLALAIPPGSGTALTVVVPEPAPTSLTLTEASGTYGGTTMVSATLRSGGSALIGKSITFTLGGESIGTGTTDSNGVVSLGINLNGINAGTYEGAVGATFSGNANYQSNSASVSLTIAKATPTLTVTGSEYTYDGSAHTGSGTATGIAGENLSFRLTYEPGGSNAPVDAGEYTVTANFDGNQNYLAASSGAAAIKINKVPLTVTAGDKIKPYGAALPELTVSYSGFVNGETLETSGINGQPALSTTATATSELGSYPIIVERGTLTSVNYDFANFVNGSLTVIKADSALALVSSANPSILNRPITFQATVSPSDVTGSVQFMIDGANFGEPVALSNGTASSQEISSLSPGDHSVTAIYLGDDHFNGSSATTSQHVSYATSGLFQGTPTHQILPPIEASGTTVRKKNSTVPAMFQVNDYNGNSIGTPGVVTSFRCVQIISGGTITPVDLPVASTNKDTAFGWDGQQWHYNIETKNLAANKIYVFRIALNDGSEITFQFALK